jgi:hypothetical protein
MAHQIIPIGEKVRLIIAEYFAVDISDNDQRSFSQLKSNRHDLGNLITVVEIQMGVLLDIAFFPQGQYTTVNAFVAEVERALELMAAA